jgi:hypothetical protein
MLDALLDGVLLISAAILYLQALPAIPNHPALGTVSLVCDTTPGHDRESPADIVRVCRTAAGSIIAQWLSASVGTAGFYARFLYSARASRFRTIRKAMSEHGPSSSQLGPRLGWLAGAIGR